MGRAGNKTSPKRFHVALLVETSLAPGRDILRGIAQYVREHEPWSLYHEPRSLEDRLPAWLDRWKGDGIIARVQNAHIARSVEATGLPAVDVLGVAMGFSLPLVHVDDPAIGRMAADHLLERGFHHFAFFGIKGENWSERRREHFRRSLGLGATALHTYEVPRQTLTRLPWEEQEDALAEWLSRLPKPVGIMVCSDQVGPHLLEACRRAGKLVPDEIAVIGVDNDETLCEVCNPPLSSVDPGHQVVGYEAARVLDRLFKEGASPAAPLLVHPQMVVVRKSSDVLATTDRQVALALRIIREQACEGLTAGQVISRLPVSRSVLQRRFRRETGRSIQDEIISVRLKRARALLAETELPLAEIAERSGFNHQEYLGAVFKARTGHTPAHYRRHARLRRRHRPDAQMSD
jgi:LacI family transcriptional regulator